MTGLLAQYSNVEVVGEASDGREAIERVGQLHPSVVLMDIMMQRMDGITATRLITNQYPDVAIIGFSCEAREYYVSAMHEAGAFEVLAKGQSVDTVYWAMQRAVISMTDSDK